MKRGREGKVAHSIAFTVLRRFWFAGTIFETLEWSFLNLPMEWPFIIIYAV